MIFARVENGQMTGTVEAATWDDIAAADRDVTTTDIDGQAITQPAVDADGGWRYRPYVDDGAPTFDAATEHVDSEIRVSPVAVTKTYGIIKMPAGGVVESGTYAAIDDGVIQSRRSIKSYAALPLARKVACDEKGDGGPSLRPIVDNGQPSYDPVTQTRTGPNLVVLPARVEMQYTVATLTGAALQQSLISYADAQRSAYRDRGTNLDLGGGVVIPVRTDRKTRDDVASARQQANLNVASRAELGLEPNWSTDWKLGNGSFVTIDHTLIAAIGDAISGHWSEAYAREKAASAGILDGTITTAAAVDSIFNA